jgi:hypothetical protein
MREIVISVCSILHSGACRDVHLTFLEPIAVTPYACFATGMFEVTKWSEANPNWIVKRWSCGEAGRMAKI